MFAGPLGSGHVDHATYCAVQLHRDITFHMLVEGRDVLLSKNMVAGYLSLWCSIDHKFMEGVDYTSWNGSSYKAKRFLKLELRCGASS